MAATIEATGTWTALNISAAAKTGPNVPTVEDIDLNSLASTIGEGTIYPELEQFIQLMSDGLALSFWPTAKILHILLGIYNARQGEVPARMRVYPAA